MAYDEDLARRLRKSFDDVDDVVEKQMFGGLAFLVAGHMSCGVVGETLMVRVGPEVYASALAEPHAREMDFTGRSLRGFVYVDPEGLCTDAELGVWVRRSLDFVLSLPPKD